MSDMGNKREFVELELSAGYNTLYKVYKKSIYIIKMVTIYIYKAVRWMLLRL